MSDESRGRVIAGDALKTLRKLPSESVHCVVTSPPYWQLRDYGVESQLGLEATPQKLNPDYAVLIEKRLRGVQYPLAGVV